MERFQENNYIFLDVFKLLLEKYQRSFFFNLRNRYKFFSYVGYDCWVILNCIRWWNCNLNIKTNIQLMCEISVKIEYYQYINIDLNIYVYWYAQARLPVDCVIFVSAGYATCSRHPIPHCVPWYGLSVINIIYGRGSTHKTSWYA